MGEVGSGSHAANDYPNEPGSDMFIAFQRLYAIYIYRPQMPKDAPRERKLQQSSRSVYGPTTGKRRNERSIARSITSVRRATAVDGFRMKPSRPGT